VHARRLTRAALLSPALLAAALLGLASNVRAQSPEPYRDPPFTCEVVDYGTDPPTLPAPPQDPLCVRYDKTNITVSTLGAIDFLAAEPGRVAIVAGKCSYWQQDHWIIRASPDTPPLVSWEGSYWYDAPSASAAGILRDLRVADQPADATTFIAALRPIVGDEAADQMAAFADDGGGGGAAFALPEGFGGDPCAASTGPTPPEPGEGGGDGGPAPPAEDPDAAPAAALPATGGSHALAIVAALLVLAAAIRVVLAAAR
jgi:hypothetical protein